MARRKRASMREGPLADLFRSTIRDEEEQPEEQQPAPDAGAPRQMRPWHRGRIWTLELPDGRWLAARPPRRGPPPFAPFGLLLTLGLLALAVAVGAYPVVRRATRRLERLKVSVEALGAGDLAARVKVEGRDEVAALAASFNRSAERIEGLVNAHKSLLANA